MKAIVERMVAIAKEPALEPIKGPERAILLGLLTLAEVISEAAGRLDETLDDRLSMIAATMSGERPRSR